MLEDADAPSQLMDIVPPTAPLASVGNLDWLIVIVVIGLILVGLLGLWTAYRWQRSERWQGLRHVSQVRKSYSTGELASREVTYWLAAFLKRRLAVRHLSMDCALPIALAKQKRRWESYLQQLHRARYASDSLSESEIAFLFTETRYWMRRWP